MYLSACGVDCEKCPLKDQCGGNCHAVKGVPFFLKDFGVEVCPLYDCAVNKKGLKTCAECAELPCQLFYDWKDPSMSDEEHLKSVEERVGYLKASLA